MRKLLLLCVVFMTGCIAGGFSDNIKISSIESSSIDKYKYKVTFEGNGVYIYTNKECHVGETIWECK